MELTRGDLGSKYELAERIKYAMDNLMFMSDMQMNSTNNTGAEGVTPRPETKAKRYLQEYQEILCRVRMIQTHLETVLERATRANSCMTGVRVSGTPMHDRTANAAVSLADGEAALRTEIEHLSEALKMRMFLIGRMDDERSKAILTARYIDGMPLKDIAKAMGLEVRYLRELYSVALQEFAAVLEETP